MIKTIISLLLLVQLSVLTHFSNGQTITTFNYTGAMQSFTVPTNSYIRIDVYGAEGGASSGYTGGGGKGARMTGTFTGLASGQVLKILVGGQGVSTFFTGGGGGGSFVVDSATNSALIVAGGGGGSYFWGGGGNGVTSANGAESPSANAGGSNGSGGGASFDGGGGGGGFTGNGVGIECSPDTNGGKSFINGGAGGSGACFPAGGYGGGGGGGNSGGGGGGGGYSGGGGGTTGGSQCESTGGGGGSYNAGINPIDSAGVNSGNGMVVITVYTTGSVTPNTTFNYTGTMQTFTVPANSYIRIDAYGAEGGPTNYSASGKGARMSGTFTGTAGKTLKILVGGQGGGSAFAAGGGGGSFVVDSATATPLIVAGGGGGDYWWEGAADADTLMSGTASLDGNAGGSAGSGGAATTCGGGGGGFSGNGAGNICTVDTNGGKSFVNGGAGGSGDCYTDCNAPGGYGGYGGGGVGTTANGGGGGGGGGYSGGGGGANGKGGGGGGSYNAGTDRVDSVGIQTGNGLVIITVHPILTGVQPVKTDYTSFKVYPNPVSSTATFDYVLTSDDLVTLDIYSTVGQKISVLNNEIQSQGKHSVQWDVKNKVPAGLYSYRLQIGESQKTGVLIVQ